MRDFKFYNIIWISIIHLILKKFIFNTKFIMFEPKTLYIQYYPNLLKLQDEFEK
jgi:hypothetical protein